MVSKQADEIELPSIRDYRRHDAAAVAKVFTRAWCNGFRGLVPEEILEVDPEEWAGAKAEELDTDYVLVAELGTEVVGFAWLREAPGFAALEEVVELHALYVLPGAHAGMALLSEAVERLEPHFSAMTLWSLDANQAALSFYEARGFRPDGETRIVERAGVGLPHSRLRRPLTVRSGVRRRPAVRVIPRAPDGSVLLMEHCNSALSHPSIWLAPGGMPEGAELPEETARREFREETGRELSEPLRRIWKRRHIWLDGSEPVEAVEDFYVADVPVFEPSTDGFTAAEQEVVTQFRWWSPKELAQTEELIVPAALRRESMLKVQAPVWVGR